MQSIDFSPDAIHEPKNQSQNSSPKKEDHLSVLIFNAKTLIKNQEYALGLQLLLKALQDKSHRRELYYLLSEVMEKLNLKNERTSVLKYLAENNPQINDLIAWAHDLYIHHQDQPAKEAYFFAINQMPFNPPELFEIYKNLGNIFLKEKDFESSEEFYHKALTLNADSDHLWVNLGTLEIQKNNFVMARENFQKAIHLNSNNDKAWVGLALISHHEHDLNLCLAHLQQALEICPRNKTALQMYIQIGVTERVYERVLNACEAYQKIVWDDGDINLVMIQLYHLTHQSDLARVELEKELLFRPRDPELQRVQQMLGLT